MKNNKMFYFIHQSIKNILRNKFMSCISLVVLIICLIITGTIYLMSVNINLEFEKIQSENEILIFLDENLSYNNSLKIKNEIDKIKNISNSIFISKEESLNNYKQQLGNNSDILYGLENDNPLRNSYKITLHNNSLLLKTINDIKKINGVINIRADQQINEILLKITSITRSISILLMFICFLLSFFIVFNTIKITLFHRKNEIFIMKIIGSTNWFIRWPFIFEGLIIGIFGSIISFFIEYKIYLFFIKIIEKNINFINIIPFSELALILFELYIVFGIIIGITSSAISIRKFLDV